MKKAIVREGKFFQEENAQPMVLTSVDWMQWLESNNRFFFKGEVIGFSARKETRRNTQYWYAYKRIKGVLAKKYLGKNSEITLPLLESVENSFLEESFQKKNRPKVGLEKELNSYDPLSLTKKIRPLNLPNRLIRRNRLLYRMQKPVVFVIAPAGFGKSTLLRLAFKLNKKQSVWLSLGENDNSLFMFIRLLHASFLQIGIDITTSGLLRLSNPEEIFRTIHEKISESAAALEANSCLTIIIDNYHLIHNEEIHRGMRYLINNLPVNTRIIIASQKKIPVSRNLSLPKENLMEIHEDDLRIEQQEAFDFIQPQIGRKINPGLEMETILGLKGWVMGIVLVTAILKDGEKITRFSKFGEEEKIQKYLVEDILARYSKATRRFLLQTSFLRELRVDLCEYVTGIPNCRQIIEDLCNEDLILSRSDNQEGVYYFTEIFASVFNAQLIQSSPEENIPLYDRAAKWYLSKGNLSSAMEYFLLFEGWEEIASVFELEDLGSLQKYNEGSKILYWFSIFPPQVFGNNYELLLISIFVVHLYGHYLDYQAYHDHIARLYNSDSIPETALQLLEETLHIFKKHAKFTVHLIEKNANLFRPANLEALHYLVEFYDIYTKVVGRDNLDFTSVEALLDQVYHRGFIFVYILGSFLYASFLQQSDFLDESEKFIDTAVDNINRNLGRYSTTLIFFLAIKTVIYLERNLTSEASQIIEMMPFYSRKRLPVLDSTTYLYHLLSVKYALQTHQNRLARKNIDAVMQLYRQSPSKLYQGELTQALRAQIFLQEENYSAAQNLLGKDFASLNFAESVIAWCQFLLHEKRYSELEKLTLDFAANNRFVLRYTSSSSIRIFHILSLQGQGKVWDAFSRFDLCLDFFQKCGAVQPFCEVGVAILDLLRIAWFINSNHAGKKEFIERIFGAFGRLHELDRPDEELDAILPVFSLSQREAEVLHSLIEGKTNSEIARLLFVSESTIKSHVHNIYSKLGIDNRFELLKMINVTSDLLATRLSASE
jgi:ATP-dependent transcriptional regulator